MTDTALEQAIHQRWAAAAGLAALLPAERFITGPAHGSLRPYAVLRQGVRRPILRTNSGDALDQVRLAIDLWHDDRGAGQAIVPQIQAAFDRAAFDLSAAARVILMRQTGDRVVRRGDSWQFTVAFLLQIHLCSGA
jgi:hypothetical protein